MRRFGTGVVSFRDANDRFHHIRETAATAAALLQAMIDFRRHDQLPGVLIEQIDDRLFDLLLGYDVAVANEHASLGWLAAPPWAPAGSWFRRVRTVGRALRKSPPTGIPCR